MKAFAAELRRHIRAGMAPREAMRRVWRDVHAGRVARPMRAKTNPGKKRAKNTAKKTRRARAGAVKRTTTTTRQVKVVRENPATLEREMQQAVDRYTGFRGNPPESVDRVKVEGPPRVMLTVGEVVGIMYRTDRDGVVEDYLHRFKKKARPTLAVSSDGRRLYLLGGAYRVTDRGIEDDA